MSEGLYLRALGHYGLGHVEKARHEFEGVFERNASHLGAWIHSGRSGNVVKL